MLESPLIELAEKFSMFFAISQLPNKKFNKKGYY